MSIRGWPWLRTRDPIATQAVTIPPASLLATGADFPGRLAPVQFSQNHASTGKTSSSATDTRRSTETPVVGVNRDNIYTVATGDQQPVEYMIGESPWMRSAPPYQAIGSNGLPLPTTDSVIFP
jgi:hypothetical protein